MGGAESKTRARAYRHQLAERPGPPGKPLLVPSDKRSPEPDVVTIRWEPPLYDGGAPITGYLVEHRRTGSPHWVRSAPQLVAAPELTLAGLEPGWRYQFRVSAQNAAGLSDPGELSDLLTVTLQRTAASAPFFVKELADTVALENEKAELSVQVRGTPTPTVAWFKDGVEIFSSRSYRVVTDNEVSTLVIYQASLSDEGEVKCSATNRVGYAVTRAKLILEAPPSIRLPRQYEEGLLFEKDEVIRLKVSVAGRPVPEVSWYLNGEPVPGGGRYEAGHSERYATLRVGEARREDRGEYQVRAINRLGEDLASFLVTVADRPMPPGRAKVVMTLGRSVTLSWSAPEDDGGCKIGNYIVEYFRVGWNMWLKAATCRQLTTTLGDLIEGSEYKFRVKAENPYGVSDASTESDVVFIPDPKRGLLEPPEHTEEEAMDIWKEDKKRPVSPTQTLDEQYGERKTKKKRGPMNPPQAPQPSMRDLIVPSDKHSMLSEDSMSPPATPEIPPPVVPPKRRGKDRIERDLQEEKETARRVEEKRRVEEFKKTEEKRQVEEARIEEKKNEEKRKEEAKKKRFVEPQSPRLERDRFHGSSELMLVLLPHSRAPTEERETTQSKKELFESSLALEGNDIAPPMSLSAPELGSGEPPEIPRVRAAFSSTELLHERAMARFYQDMEQEEVETKRRGSVQRRRSFGSRPRDTLEKTASLQEILSSLRSLNEEVEKKRELLLNDSTSKKPLAIAGIAKSERISFTGDSMDSVLSTEERKKTLLQQTSEEDMEYEDSSFEEDEEYEEEESVMEPGEEELDEELEEEEEEEDEGEFTVYSKRGSIYTSESEDERYSLLEDDTYHPTNVNTKYNEDSLISAYEGRGPLILPQRTGPLSLPNPSQSIPSSSVLDSGNEVKLKPILKKPSIEINNVPEIMDVGEINRSMEAKDEPQLRSPVSPEIRFEPNFSPVMPKPILKVRDHSQEKFSPLVQRKGAPVAEVEPELNLVSSRGNLDDGSDYESSTKKKQVRIEEPDEMSTRALDKKGNGILETNTQTPETIVEQHIKPPDKPVTPTVKTIKSTEKPQEEMRKRGASLDDEVEAAKVLINHYSDIVAEYGRGRRPNKPRYLDFEALRAAAEEEEKRSPALPDIIVNEPTEAASTSYVQEDILTKEPEILDIEPTREEAKSVVEAPKAIEQKPPKKIYEQPETEVFEPMYEPSKHIEQTEPSVTRKRDRSVDSQARSIAKRDRSVDSQARSIDTRDRGFDSQAGSNDKRGRPIEIQARSLDKRDRSVETQARSIDKRDMSVDIKFKSKDKRDRSVDSQARSTDKRDGSIDRRDTQSDKRDKSIDKRDRSVDRRDMPADGRDRTIGRRDRSKDRRDRSVDTRDRSVDGRERSLERSKYISQASTSVKRRSPSPWKMKKETKRDIFPEDKTDIARTPSPSLRKYTTPEQTVHSFFDFLMDLSLFLLACWLYLFKDERLSIPVLGLMVYRQANEAFQRKMAALKEKSKRLMFWRRKQ
ncbi:titin homolog [Macrosteles quadrilineatus]|uniref:titin homolog n=1 Tax=Macrosteles quadrilineatus TaxID=74068 RepID=UPI0023E14056|nr:titin homolog [Macrosteles quadrilineatus]